MSPMYAISYFVGRKYGSWFTGSQRFHTEADAQRQIDADRSDEHFAGATKLGRRVVRA